MNPPTCPRCEESLIRLDALIETRRRNMIDFRLGWDWTDERYKKRLHYPEGWTRIYRSFRDYLIHCPWCEEIFPDLVLVYPGEIVLPPHWKMEALL